MAEKVALGFGGLLRQLRVDAGLTQEELAEGAGLSLRAISDLERGVNLTARKETARLLADALCLTGPERALFDAAARGRAAASGVLAGGTLAKGPAAAATRTLPRDIAGFTGRERELAWLAGAGEVTPGVGGVVGIYAVGGMAGVGKTTFAVHAAHRLAERFPDGQFFLPLHGHTPGRGPVDPVDALASLLLTAGVAAQQIPPGLEARAARWRDCVAGRKILLLLDDAVGHEQVRPLLPGTAGTLVLVTSRKHLTALEDSVAISLDTLPPGDAMALLARLAGRPGLQASDAGVSEIARLCGYLPLAIGMLASQLHHHPAWTTAGLAADLASARDRLELMQAENLSATAAFGLSYGDLTPSQQRLFRRLGLIPGSSIDAHAAAAVDDTDPVRARRHLSELYDQHLLTEPAPGRYVLHDLLREYARALAATEDPAVCDDAVGRLLRYYVTSARAADWHLVLHAGAAPDGDPPVLPPHLPSWDRALAWMRAERLNLQACLEHAAAAGRHLEATQIAAAMSTFLYDGGYWDEALSIHQAAATAAEAAGDRHGQARALIDLGAVQRLTDDYATAVQTLTQALDLARSLGDQHSQAWALIDLGGVWYSTGDYRAATEALVDALSLCGELNDRQGQARAICYLGGVRYESGDYPAAAQTLTRALELYGELGNRLGQMNTLLWIGTLRRVSGDYAAAAESLTGALAISRSLGNRLGEANALHYLGAVLCATGDYQAATRELIQALDLFRSLGDHQGEANTLSYLGRVQHEAGDYSAAATSLTQALDIACEFGDRHAQAEALAYLGRLYLTSAGPDKALVVFTDALRVADELQSPLHQARALDGIGRCRARGGDTSAAAGYLSRALALYQTLNVPEAAEVTEALVRLGTDQVP